MEGLRGTDRFVSYSKAVISSQDYQTLTLFYQPIIGEGAFVLYCTLAGLLDRQKLSSKEYLHSDLESLVNKSIQDIEKDRHRLEAIGLIDTFYQNDQFIYEINMPLSPAAFVNDGVLGEYLKASITKERFLKMLDIFKTKSFSKKNYIRITKSFDEVFPSLPLSEPENEEDLIGIHNGNGVSVNYHPFEWRTFEESIPKEFYDSSLLTKAVKMKILNLAYVYGLNELDARDIYAKCFDEKTKIVSLSKLATEARELYKLTSRKEGKANKEPLKHIEDLPHDPLEYFKVVPPIQLLKELGDGHVNASDLRVAERLIEDIGLDKGVANVLLAYTFQIKNGNLPSYDYFEKVGSSWKRNQIKSVELAMDYVKHLKSQYDQSVSKGKKTPYTKSNKPDIEIDWLDEYYNSIE
ncbi:MAG: DnaD domain protein [Firmicutes bacterium]|nr:DnaD domain protein [Bacillota bacterium]